MHESLPQKPTTELRETERGKLLNFMRTKPIESHVRLQGAYSDGSIHASVSRKFVTDSKNCGSSNSKRIEDIRLCTLCYSGARPHRQRMLETTWFHHVQSSVLNMLDIHPDKESCTLRPVGTLRPIVSLFVRSLIRSFTRSFNPLSIVRFSLPQWGVSFVT